jgi:UDP-N-acetylmuramate dehydrogenase
MEISKNVSLRPYNTFGVEARAEELLSVSTTEQALEAASYLSRHRRELLVLGGGSNVLFRANPKGTVLVNRIFGVETVNATDEAVWLRVGAGEVWHDFVEHCIDRELAGIENLALIPGRVGASPMQNIGAYGVEIESVFDSLEAVHLPTGEVHRFDRHDCRFGYRESVFKSVYKGQYLITHVTYRLSREPNFNTAYGAIGTELERMGVNGLSLRAVADAVISIRRSKLPDPAVLGNAGSFFKNPVVSADVYAAVKALRPDVVAYPAGDGAMKLAAGWLIEQAGWKGHRVGACGVHDRQALVLVNHGSATGNEIYALSSAIVDDVNTKFGVELEREVNIIG